MRLFGDLRIELAEGNKSMWKCTYCETMNLDEQPVCVVCGNEREVDTPPQTLHKEKKGTRSFWYVVILVIIIAVIAVAYLTSMKGLRETDSQGTSSSARVRTEVSAGPVYLTMGFHEIYQCSIEDFGISAGDIDNLTWACSANASGLTCSSGGVIRAGNILVNPIQGYNESVRVTGVSEDGLMLVYYVTTGNGQAYEFCWSGARTMKNYRGSVYQITPMVTGCTGFTLFYTSVLTSGDIIGDQWSVWVRENGTDWVYVQDITLQDGIETKNNIRFDEAISFSEVAVQPPKQYNEFSNTIYCEISNLVFD